MSARAEGLTPSPVFYYQVYGLNIASGFAIPELSASEPGTSDVRVRFGPVPEHLSEPTGAFGWAEYSGRTCLFKFKDVGRFLIEDGQTITIDRRQDQPRDQSQNQVSRGKRGPGTPPADLRVFLLGSAFGALLHQRGWLPLHVSAVQAGTGVWAFTGDSGAGKSTLATWLHRRFDWPIVSDDVSTLKPNDASLQLHPGPRKLKLWQDAVDHLGCHDEKLVQDLSNTPKFQLYLSDQKPWQPGPIRSLVLLDRCEEDEPPTLEPLKGTAAFEAVMSAIYRPYMAEWFRDPVELMRDLIAVCQQIKVYRFRRQWNLDDLEDQHRPLLDQLLAKR